MMNVTAGAVRADAGRPDLGGKRWRVDEGVAREVAASFEEQRPAPADPLVRRAYAELSDQADRWFAHVTGHVSSPVRVAFTSTSEPYSDAYELRGAVRDDRVLEVGSVAHDRDRRHPLLDHSLGGVHDRLRAVHDIVSHGWSSHDFSRDGEFSAWLGEDRLYTGLARWALATELHAHHSVRWTSGELAPYQPVLLDLRLLGRSIRARRPDHRPAAA